jgi:hypothetical protein
MAMYMRETGLQTKLKAREFTLTWTELNMKASGKRINNTVKVKRHGLMELCTRGTTFTGKSMGLVISCGAMVQYIKASFSTTILKEMESIDGLMEGLSKANGRTIRCTGEESLHGLMGGNTKENI